MTADVPATVVGITHLRDCLGIACQHVAQTDEPIIVRRYKAAEVALVPLWEWRFLKGIEAAIRDGRIPVDGILAEFGETGRD